MMLYENTKARVHSLDGYSFAIVTGVPKGNTLLPYLFIFCLDCQFRSSIDLVKENGSTIRRYSAKTIKDTDYADDLSLHTNASAFAEYLLHSLEKAAGDTDICVNAINTEDVWERESGNKIWV